MGPVVPAVATNPHRFFANAIINLYEEAFLLYDSRVLTVREPLEPPGSIRSEIIDRSSKRAVWTNDGYEEAISFVARTGTADLVLALRGPAMLAIACPAADICWRFSNSRLLVVRQDGSTSEVAGRYLTDW